MLVPETRYLNEAADRLAPPVETLAKLLGRQGNTMRRLQLNCHRCLFLMNHGGRAMTIRGRKTFLTFNLQVDASRFVDVMQLVNVNHVKVYTYTYMAIGGS